MKGVKSVGDVTRKGKLVEVIKIVTIFLSNPKQHRLMVTFARVALDDAPVGATEKRREAMGQASSRTGETRSRGMFDGLIGELEKKIPSSLTKDLEFYPALGAEDFQNYLNKP
ncbi:hypothetical protein Adt_22013 [Abeliophyllum distichum]|uniref:Uncharacterized protein n=1 Tax=Abeliophyllum distichum TaxID=126358 RepID=A0ABD1T142_9LAMI